ncbi:MAG: nucleotidyltransferase domain-containing protein [Caloramator sp.]|nr:nucleotidyltransferase domain-containing protein [Caloramator sp.]
MKQKDLNEVVECINNKINILLEQFDIKLVYIFGSYAKGTNTKNSDLDIAFLLGQYNFYDKLNLISELVGIFNRDDIDVVILNDANSILKFQVIKYGKIVYMASEYEKVIFESKTMDEYMDMEFFRERQKQIMDITFKEKWGMLNDKEYS